jgi:hypothetical protein
MLEGCDFILWTISGSKSKHLARRSQNDYRTIATNCIIKTSSFDMPLGIVEEHPTV